MERYRGMRITEEEYRESVVKWMKEMSERTKMIEHDLHWMWSK